MSNDSRENNALKPSTPQLSEAELRAALDKVVLDSMRPVLLGLGALYAFFVLAHILFLKAPTVYVMAPLAAITAIVFFSLRYALGRWAISPRWAHPIGGVLAGLALLNSLVHLYLEYNPLQTTNVMLLAVGVGFLLLSTRWLVAVLGVSVVAWVLVMLTLPPTSMSVVQHFGFAMLSAVALSAVVHVARIRTVRRLEGLRIQDEYRKAELEAALSSTESSRRALELSSAVGHRVASILDLSTLLTDVAELIKDSYGYYYVGIFLVDESGEYVVARAGTGEAGRALSQQGFRLKIGEQGIIGWVAKHRQPARVDDVTLDSRYVFVRSVPRTRSELALPLQRGEAMLGVLDIQCEQLAAFSEQDMPAIESLADQVTIAIQNALLYQREQIRRRLSDTLYEVGRALSGTLDLTEVLNLILDRMAEIISYDRASVMLPSSTGEVMDFVASRGFPGGGNPQLRILIKENDIFDQIYRTQKPLLIPNVAEWPVWQHSENLPKAQSWMGVPLVRSNQVIGMVSLTRETPNPYTSEDATLGITFAGQAAVALDNARLYDQLRRAFDQLERLDRAKSDFIAVVAHELRTPLTVLRGSSQMLLGDSAIRANEFHRQLVESINTGAARLHEIVNTILDMTKIDARALKLHTEPVSVPMQIRDVHDEFKTALLERNLTLNIEDMSSLPLIEADPDLVRKVFYQLIINAIKYTPDGGVITVSGRECAPLALGEDTPSIEFIVCDTGIGIDPQFHDLIFEKFYQTGQVALHSSGKTKFKGGGPGLGLAIAKGVVEAHGGRIWVHSTGHDEEKMPGSHFHLVLPVQYKPPTPH